MPERRSVMEVMEVMEVTECDGAMTDVASTYVLCPRFEEPSVC